MEEKEKKKRWRPSVTAYRQLESQCRHLSAEVVTLKEERDVLGKRVKVSEDALERQKSANDTLEMSNTCLDKEVKRLRAVNEGLDKRIAFLQADADADGKRGFWKRLFHLK